MTLRGGEEEEEEVRRTLRGGPPLDNSWMFKDTDAWAPVEVPPPQPDLSSSDTVIGPLHLWDPHQTQRIQLWRPSRSLLLHRQLRLAAAGFMTDFLRLSVLPGPRPPVPY
ncbi:hypothetical protein NHX12_014762 [Muraenolepis orangiensis]|uniref:Uncharacterized protein n=1 Tax=Muraenolepis orangiensis TaxID=630683 RepID=A0A9Q0DAQ7_9TELE|nr:hypothetical protein NHX12_014762 [Muraenolepis orangiensis]